MSIISRKKGVGIFFKESIKGFKTNGAFFPSSKFLGEKMLEQINFEPKICVVELGGGTGAFTKQIIDKLPPDGRLIVFEINPSLAKFLRNSFPDSRVTILEADAGNISENLNKIGIDKVKYIVSGLPLGNFRKNEKEKILISIKDSLQEGGLYIQFQYLLASYLHIKKFFKIKIVGYEYRNIPPAFVYRCVR